MKVIIQRSADSRVIVDGKICGEIESGYVLLSSFTYGDTEEIVDKMINKILNIRIFEDEQEKMNKSLIDMGGSILNISQFTLYADTTKGRRPSFKNALESEKANHLYQYMNNKLSSYGVYTQTGVFGASMKVEINNIGPVTIILDSKEL